MINMNHDTRKQIAFLSTNKYIQGHSQHPSENNGLLLPKYESERPPKPTGGSPEVVHLIKHASLVFR